MDESSATSGLATTFPIVGVGASSAGGAEAFGELLRQVPAGSGLAFVLIQPSDPTHRTDLSATLARTTSFPVLEIRDGMRVQPDHVYVVPSHAHVGIREGTLALFPRSSDERKTHSPIDFFFRALAADLGSRAIGVVLSDTGADGAEGVRAIKAEDGVTFGGPDAAIATGAIDICLPVPEVGRQILRIGRHPFVHRQGAQPFADLEDEGELGKVLALVHGAVGIDFSGYERTGIRRRLARRMALKHLTEVDDYVRLLRENRAEVQALSEDFLVQLTSFFRDGATFDRLEQLVFPEILRRKRGRGPIRIWSVGCSTGEEPTSILIALLEVLARNGASDLPIQLFGTDVSQSAIEKARVGVFSEAAVQDVRTERLARFFTKREGGGYLINKSVRERCTFARHDIATDPPFSGLDLVCCRNLLVSFGEELQRRVLAALQFALDESGFFLLGRDENIADEVDLFRPIDEENKIFVRTAIKGGFRSVPARHASPVPAPIARARLAAVPDLVRRTESLLLHHYAPPGVIVNGRMEVLHFRGRTEPYLAPVPGQLPHDLLNMARRGLVADLRIGIAQARNEKATVRRTAVRVEQDGATRTCDIVVAPVSFSHESPDEVFAIFFEEPPRSTGTGDVAGLEDELRTTKEHLLWRIDEHRWASEELLSANAALVSRNEELQSLNAEIQAAKEQIQSTNEELSALNEEIQTRNTELDAVNGDLVNVLASVTVPIVIVDANRRIRRFTPKARSILNLVPADVGRPIDDVVANLLVENLDQRVAGVIDAAAPHDEEVQSREGRWYRLQIRPYLTVDEQIDGAVLTFVDIDILKRALGAAEWARDHAKATVEAVQVPLVVLTDTLEIASANRAFQEQYGAPEALAQAPSVGEGVLDNPALRSALDGVRQRDDSFQGLELDCELPTLGRRCLSVSARAVPMPDTGRLILLAIEDITARRRDEAERAQLLRDTQAAQASAEEANRTKDIFLATLSHELRTPLSTLLLSAELLRTGKLDAEKVQWTIDAIARATNAQAQLVDDLLDISRIVTGKMKMELRAVNLAACVQAAVDALMPAAETKQIEIAVALSPSSVAGDPIRLQQVVSNLVANAIKFTPPRGRVRLAVDTVDGRGRICVTDTGVGIDASFLPQLFDRFTQEDRGDTRVHGGLGLGLAIVRYLVEAHGGTVQADSAGKGQGSSFTVLLPLMTTSEARRSGAGGGAPAAATTANIKGTRILVVEDDLGTRSALSEMLSLSGADVRSAGSAAAAMDVFRAFRPDLLVSDIAMPGEDGYSLLSRIRALGRDGGGLVPAVAMTALAAAEDLRRALEAGFNGHLAKPVEVEQLLAVLTRLLAPAA